MKKLILIIHSLLAFTYLASAQNYQCVYPGVKQYFTNGDHYLRGARIDSVKTAGGNTVLYPFHSPRGSYFQANLDTNSGSWLGKTITIAPDGTHYFDNYWGDTVIIKTRANLNDTWILFNDTTSIYYTGKVTAIDTMTVLGTLDSVKHITINAYNSSGMMNADPLNNAQILISKNKGFVQACDLFMFPLHKPDSVYTKGMDYFLDWRVSTTLNTKSIMFQLVNFHYPPQSELYDFNIGDVFMTHVSDPMYSLTILDKIVQKNPYISYRIAETSTQAGITTVPGNIVWPYPTQGTTIDSSLMPEESGQQYFYNYDPADTEFCTISASYELTYNNILSNGAIKLFEPIGDYTHYKTRFGLVEYEYDLVSASQFHGQKLTYASKGGTPCGPIPILGIPSIGKETVSVFPNPATDQISIKFEKENTYNLSLTNALGQAVYRSEWNTKEGTISVAHLANGIYSLQIRDVAGNVTREKIVVQH